MGCTSSREARRDMRWVGRGGVGSGDDDNPRVHRSLSLPGDRRLLRARAASVLSSLGLGHGRQHAGANECTALSFEEMMKSANDQAAAVVFPGEEAAAKRRVALRTPTGTPPQEPEVINAWELMAGLEDTLPTPRTVNRCMSFDTSPHVFRSSPPRPPPWMQHEPDALIMSDFDPEILSGFRQALEEMSPQHPTLLLFPEQQKPAHHDTTKDSFDMPMPPTCDIPELSGIVRARIDAFQEKIEQNSPHGADHAGHGKAAPLWPPGGEGKAVVYFTSLRGVRKTFEDCRAVRAILRSYGVRVDERDVSMHAGFKAELGELLGPGFAGAMLPRVFVDGQYLGGAEDVRVLHEAGELGRALDGCTPTPMGKLGYAEACAACGDVRFIPCETCSGSCRVFVEQEEADDECRDVSEFRRCQECNENGLIRCPVCCC